jgi:hypothetical protein
MAHKKKGKKSAASSAAHQGNGAAKQPGTQATGEPQSFKDAVLKDLHADAAGKEAPCVRATLLSEYRQ